MNKSDGALQLADLVKPRISSKRLAKLLGCDSSLISLWITGRRRPSLEMARKLEKETKIPMRAWLE